MLRVATQEPTLSKSRKDFYLMTIDSTLSKMPTHAFISIVGFSTIVVVGVASCIAIVFAAMWALVQFLLTVLQCVAETIQTIETLYTTSDPFIRLFMLASIAYLVCRVYCKTARK
jgi:hypothetical protein